MKVSNHEQADPRLVAPARAGLRRLPLTRRRRWWLWPRRGCRRRSVARKRPLSGGRGGDAGSSFLVVNAGRRPRTCQDGGAGNGGATGNRSVPYPDVRRQVPESAPVGTRKMVNYARRGRSQRKLWWRFEAVLTCKSIVRAGYRGERLIEPSSSWFPPKFPSG